LENTQKERKGTLYIVSAKSFMICFELQRGGSGRMELFQKTWGVML